MRPAFRPFGLWWPLLLAFIALPFGLSAQNQRPSVSIQNVSVDTSAKTVHVDYSLADAESDACEVWLRVSNDGGKTFVYPVNNVSGDVGFPIAVGARQLTWTYDTVRLADGAGSFSLRIVADDRQVPSIASILQRVDSNAIWADLNWLASAPRHRSSNPVHLEDSRNWIESQYVQHGLQARRDSFEYQGYQGINFLGDQRGWVDEASVWIADGHYDSVEDAPGADDNGTAVMGVVHSLLALHDLQFKKTIRYIGFDLEETFDPANASLTNSQLGSNHYVQTQIPNWEKIEGVLNMEMLGYYNDQPNSQSVPNGFQLLFPTAYNEASSQQFRGNFLTVVSANGVVPGLANVNSFAVGDTFTNVSRRYVPDLRIIQVEMSGSGLTATDLYRSDHAQFWRVNKPAIMLTDGANLRNNHYHTPADSVGTLNKKFLTQNIQAVVATLATQSGLMHAGKAEIGGIVLGQALLNRQTALSASALKLSAWPNPASGRFTLQYQLAQPGVVDLAILDAQGRQVAQLVKSHQVAGTHLLDWQAQDAHGHGLAEGFYTARLSAEGQAPMSIALLLFGHDH